MNEILTNILYAVVASIVIPLISYAGMRLSAYLKAKTDNEKIRCYIDNATKAVNMAVLEASQTYVDELKKAGNFTADAQKAAFERSLSVARALITKDAINAIQSVYGDFDAWLKAQIEAQVNKTK